MIFYRLFKRVMDNLREVKMDIKVAKAKKLSDKAFVKQQYFRELRRIPDLEDPKLFTEKIQWMKLNYRNELYPICADKYKVRDFVKEEIGERFLIPLIFSSNNPQDFLEINLPENFIIKMNHTSGYNLVVRNRRMSYSGKMVPFKREKVVSLIQKWLKVNVFYLNREWEYDNIPPRYIIEELLQDESGNNVLNDYKIHCFDGKPTFIQTIFDRDEYVKEDWFDTSWNALDISYFSKNKKNLPKPTNLSEMLKIASTLSEHFLYVRVDLYSVNEKVYFGELTFHPYSGVMRFNPKEWDEKLGSLLKLPLEKQRKMPRT